MKKLISTALIVCFALGTLSFCAADEIPWMTNFQAAMEQAQKENKPVLLHFYGDFCGPCKTMDRTVFPDPNVVQTLTKNFIPVKIDTSRDQATSKKYGIRGIPADVFVTPQGEILHQRVGMADTQKYLQEVQKIAQIAHAKLNMTAQHNISEQHIVSQQPQNEVNTTFANEMNRQSYESVLPQTADLPKSAYFMENPSKQSISQNHDMKIGGGLPLKTTTIVRRPIAGLSFENNTPQNEPRLEQPTQKIAQNSNIPEPPVLPEKPLLFDGYCPVTLSLETSWVKGKKEFFAEYEDGLFYFVSEDARNMFLETPCQYAPVASGHDVVEWAVSQKKVLGSRKFGAWFQGNVYLFTNRDNYDRFQANPHFFAGQALQLGHLFSHQLR